MLPLPAKLLLLQFSLASFIIGFTPISSPLRETLLPTIIICTWGCVTTSKFHIQRTPWAALVGGYSVTYLLQYISIVLLSKWRFDSDAIQRKADTLVIDYKAIKRAILHRSPFPFLARLKYGIAAASTFRDQMEKKNARPLASYGRQSTVKRSTFLYHTAFKILTTYLILDLMGQGTDSDSNTKTFASTKVPLLSRLHEVSVVEVVMRALVTFGAGVGIYCSQEGLQSSIAFLAVATGLSEAEDWKPRFGSVTEAYSIQRFWSRFWHQINRRLVADPTKFILHDVFNVSGLANDTILRYTTLLLHFLISGLHHLAIDIASGIPWHESGAVRFFLMQGLGIILERTVRFSYRTVFPGSYVDSQPALWIRILGHVWVIVFLSWTIPGWMYPMISRTRNGLEDSLLPFSVLAHVF